jgi:hypothetical protein
MSNEHNNAPAVPPGWKLVPEEPTEAQWGELARDIMLAFDMSCKSPALLLNFLKNVGREIPKWLLDEVRDPASTHVLSKGTRVVIIYRAMLAATPAPAPAVPVQEPAVPQGWVEQMLTDARHVFDARGPETPQETRDVIEYVASWIAAYRDNLAATPTTPAPVVAGTRIESGVMIMKDGKAWGVAYSDGQTTAYGWVTPEQATIHDPKHLVKPTDATWQGSGYADELRKGKIVHVERRTQVIVKEQP